MRAWFGEGGRSGWALCLMCIGWATLSATLLHQAVDRPGAAWIVPLAWVWGLTALFAALKVRIRYTSPWVVLALALAIRGPLIGSPPWLSDDAFRYLFEGHVLNAGLNPFAQAPAELGGLLEEVRQQVNHPKITSVYPPLALLWFRLLDLLGAGLVGAQAMAALADTLIVAALWRMGGVARRGALLYALHPLAALESASGAHLEAPAIALLAWACALPRFGAFLGTLSAGVKLLPALILAPLVKRAGIGRGLAGLAVGALVLLFLALPVLDAGDGLSFALTNYARHWSFNGLIYPWLAPFGADESRIGLMLVGAGLSLWLIWRFRDRPLAAWWAIASTFLALTPTVHPWYGLWAMVPALALGRWAWAIAGTALIGSYGVLVSYDTETGAWSEPAWLWGLTWLPVLAAVLFDRWWPRRSQPSAPPRPTAP